MEKINKKIILKRFKDLKLDNSLLLIFIKIRFTQYQFGCFQ